MTEEESYSSPSFNYYSSDKLEKIAAQINNNNNDDDGDVEFEFCFVNSEHEQILLSQPQYDVESEEPVFDKDPNLITNRENKRFDSSVTIAMSKLLIHDHECDNDSSPPSCSSSDDESENIPAVRYCVWMPKKNSETTPSCKKSKSTGSTASRTCTTIRGFMRRSNSEGKGDFVFLTPKKEKVSNMKSEKKVVKVKVSGGAVAPTSPSPSAHEALYLRNRAAKESYKKKSYLPYRQDLFGFFAGANGVGKTMPYF